MCQQPDIIPLFAPPPSDPPPPEPTIEGNPDDPAAIITGILINAMQTLEDAPTCHVQEWVGDIQIQVTAWEVMRQTYTIWSIGRPTPGEYTLTTDDSDEAVAILANLIEGGE